MKLLQTTCDKDRDWTPWIKAGDTVWYIMTAGWDENQKAVGAAKGAGFNFSGKKDPASGKWTGKKLWCTNDIDKAAKLADYAIGDCRKALTKRQLLLTTSLADSKKADTTMYFPHPEGIDYFPFQRAGIEYVVKRPPEIKGTIIGDEPGVGKTIQAIGVYNTVHEIKTCLIICPAKLKFNWKREFNKWKTKSSKVAVADTKVCPLPEHGYDIVITNYDSLPKLNKKLAAVEWDLLVVDEAHNYRNVGTQRWESFQGNSDKGWLPINGKMLLLLTGTPIFNRPKELWNLISLADPDKWNTRTAYMYLKRYCNASRTAYGLDTKGHGDDDKLAELQTILRQRCMIRRLKVDVLTELPAKIKQVVTLEYDEDDIVAKNALEHEKMYKNHNEDDMFKAAVNAELLKASDNEEEYRAAIENIVNENKARFSEMAKIRHETAVAKIPYAIEYVEGLLESESKIVVFAHHQDVLLAFAKKFPLNSITIDGDTSPQNTQLRVDRFQTDENCNVALISIQAGGVGLTLTAANYGVFVEMDWVPGINSQAGDRLHRIGQLKTVCLMFLILEDSIDAHIAQACVEKQEVIDKVLDGEYTPPEVTIITRDNAATKNTSRAKVAEQAKDISNWQILYVHQALKFLANDDGDYAKGVNGIGYNKIDTAIGHSLAEQVQLTPKQAILGMKICKKYSRQLPSELYDKIFNREKIESDGW